MAGINDYKTLLEALELHLLINYKKGIIGEYFTVDLIEAITDDLDSELATDLRGLFLRSVLIVKINQLTDIKLIPIKLFGLITEDSKREFLTFSSRSLSWHKNRSNDELEKLSYLANRRFVPIEALTHDDEFFSNSSAKNSLLKDQLMGELASMPGSSGSDIRNLLNSKKGQDGTDKALLESNGDGTDGSGAFGFGPIGSGPIGGGGGETERQPTPEESNKSRSMRGSEGEPFVLGESRLGGDRQLNINKEFSDLEDWLIIQAVQLKMNLKYAIINSGEQPRIDFRRIADDYSEQVSDERLDQAIDNMDHWDLIATGIDTESPNKEYIAYLNNAGIQRGTILLENVNQQTWLPASDRVVTLDHNSPQYIDVMDKLDKLIESVEQNHSNDFDEKEQRLAELKAGKTLLQSIHVSSKSVIAVLGSALIYLADKFLGAPIGELAQTTWEAVKPLLGF